MMLLTRLFLIPAACLGLASAGAGAITVDPKEDRGTWEAWGCSLSWWARVFGDREELADLIFTTKTVTLLDTELPGLGMNFARYNAGACSWNEIDGRRMVASRIIEPFRQIEGFWLDGRNPDPNSEAWNWSVDAKQRAMLVMASKRGADHLELFSNSPMWWMCRNDNPSGAANAHDDNLREDQYENFSIYLAEIARRAKRDWGVTFTTVSPFNEPMSGWWDSHCKQEGCHVSREAQEDILPLLRKTLDARGLRDLTIAASDENTYDEAVDTWRSFRPSVKELVGRINVHGYQYENGRRDQLHAAAKRSEKPLWDTEYSDGEASGMKMARNLLLDFEWLQPTAWAYWQPLDYHEWGLIAANLPAKRLLGVNPKYHVLAQFTRHLRPGMRIIGSGSPDAVAGYDRKARRLALVVLNHGDARDLEVDLSRFRTGRAAAARWVTEPERATRYEVRRDLEIQRNTLVCPLPAHSVVTVEVRNLDP